MEALFANELFQYLLLGTAAQTLASVANALVPNEGANAGPLKRIAGKIIRGAALGVGQAIPKKAE